MAPINSTTPAVSAGPTGLKPELILITDEFGRQVVVGVFDPESTEPIMVEQVAEGVYQAVTATAEQIHYIYTPTTEAQPARGVFRRVVERRETDAAGRQQLVTVAETEYDGVTRHVIESAVATYVVRPGNEAKVPHAIEPQRTSSTAPSSQLQLVVGGVSLVTERRFEIVVPTVIAALGARPLVPAALARELSEASVPTRHETDAARSRSGSVAVPATNDTGSDRFPQLDGRASSHAVSGHGTLDAGAIERSREGVDILSEDDEITSPGWREPIAAALESRDHAIPSRLLASLSTRLAADDARPPSGGTYDLATVVASFWGPTGGSDTEVHADVRGQTEARGVAVERTERSAGGAAQPTAQGFVADVPATVMSTGRGETARVPVRESIVETPLQSVWSSLASLWGQTRSMVASPRPLPLELPDVPQVGAAPREHDGEGGRQGQQHDQSQDGQSDAEDVSEA
ncbi:MAG: hypothetical protein HY696_03685 [Deltaproteobacteria bacterium]|nr:hypothetical protein [Deltaproteobacteria bacterium]